MMKWCSMCHCLQSVKSIKIDLENNIVTATLDCEHTSQLIYGD